VWFAMDGEGGTTTDYRAYVGDAFGRPSQLNFASSGFSASGASSADSGDTVWQNIFPAPTFESPGAPGKRWIEVELSQDTNNVITWRMNGHLIAQRVNTSPFTTGNVMIGFMDLFPSIASPAADSFVLFDNVRVEKLALPVAPTITTPPQSVAVYAEEAAEFSVAASGTAPLFFQWRFNGVDIPGATNNDFALPQVQAENIGNYSVLVSNAAGSVISAAATLTLLDSPYLSSVQATPGAHSALISWHTTEPGDSQVEFTA